MRKQEEYKNILKFMMSITIWSLVTLSWAFVWMNYYAAEIMRPFKDKGNWLIISVYAFLIYFFTNFYGGYRIGYYRKEDVIYSSTLALLITNIITYFQTALVGREIMSVTPFIIMTLTQIAVIWAWAVIATKIYIGKYPPHKMLFIFSGESLANTLSLKMHTRKEKYNIHENLNINVGIEKVQECILGYSSVILCDLPAKERNHLLKYCYKYSIRTYTTSKISDVLIRGAYNINLFDTPLLLNRNQGLSIEQKISKRALDLFISSIALVIVSPLMLITAILIKAYDGGPVFFRQDRCTINNEIFSVLKFRSMVVDAEKDGVPQPAVNGDSRITPIGNIIRMMRIDELPQLINVLNGEMSLVGPRPERIEHVEKYTKEMPEFIFRSKVKAGLTGYAQVFGRYNTSAYDKLKMDLMYITEFSLFNDIKIMMMTVKILFMKNSTEGF